MKEFSAPSRRLEKVIGGELPIFCCPRSELLRQLIDKSTQPHILKTTPGDASRRFRSEATLSRWQRTAGRVVYALTDPSGEELAGITWYRPKPLPRALRLEGDRQRTLPNHTLALRLYGDYTGRRLARPLLAVTLQDYISKPENGVDVYDFGGVWLHTSKLNTPALRTYEHVGFETVGDDKGRITMVLSPSQILHAISMGD